MKNRRTKGFKELFSSLPKDIQLDADQTYEVFLKNPSQPSIAFHFLRELQVKSEPPGRRVRFFSVRIGKGYRAVGYVEDGKHVNVWFWIGNHPDYDTKFQRGRFIVLPVP